MSKYSINKLSQKIDGHDTFMLGHRVIQLRRNTRLIPAEWAEDDKKVQELLLRSFPKLKTNALHRRRAARWNWAIYLFFRMRYTYGQIAVEMEESTVRIKRLINCIHRAAEGMTASNRKRTGLTGRPKKVV